MGLIEFGRRAPGARLEGQPHRRGRGRPRSRAPRAAPSPRRAPPRAPARRVERRDGGREWGGKGVLGAVASGERRDRDGARGRRGDRPALRRPGDVRPRRHAGQAPARRQRDARRLAGGRQGRRRGAAGSRCTATSGAPNAHLLPVPLLNVINGGAHALNSIDFQEYMLAPVGAPTFAEALRWGAETYHALRTRPRREGPVDGRGRRGRLRARPPRQRGGDHRAARGHRARGLHPRRGRRHRARPCDLGAVARRRLRAARARAGRSRAPSSWTTGSSCAVATRSSRSRTAWPRTTGTGWRALTERLGDTVQLVGDDVFVTNPELLQRGIDEGVANAILIKLNQIGTLTETLDTVGPRDGRRLPLGDLAPLRGDRGHDGRRPRRRGERRAAEGGCARAIRPRREVQPAAAHRRGARRRRALRRCAVRSRGGPRARLAAVAAPASATGRSRSAAGSWSLAAWPRALSSSRRGSRSARCCTSARSCRLRRRGSSQLTAEGSVPRRSDRAAVLAHRPSCSSRASSTSSWRPAST